MKATKIISTHAKIDLSEASKWYENQKKGLGKRFLNEVKEATDVICKNPTGFQIYYDDYRIYFTKIFSYSIHYQYIENKNEIHIKAIFHTSRNPQIWEQRM
ncbi:MAG: type II toxin-antitoxin system RelE/ParE family toxin [Bacteroidales bacterium]|jgi:plasmid stabilization system protein ParE|nr:type II toxin-antitoxin system RelE/ParE family toxin [Bacteroidales bacterium]